MRPLAVVCFGLTVYGGANLAIHVAQLARLAYLRWLRWMVRRRGLLL